MVWPASKLVRTATLDTNLSISMSSSFALFREALSKSRDDTIVQTIDKIPAQSRQKLRIKVIKNR